MVDVLRERPGGDGRQRAESARRPAGGVADATVRQRRTRVAVVRRPGDRAECPERQSHLQGRVHVRVQRHVPVAVQPGHARRPARRLLFREEGHLARQRGQGAAQEAGFADEHDVPRKRIRQLRKGKSARTRGQSATFRPRPMAENQRTRAKYLLGT